MYQTPAPEEILSQGDLIDDCPLITIRSWPPDPGRDVRSEAWTIRVVVLTQACDLAQGKTTRVVVAPVHEASGTGREGHSEGQPHPRSGPPGAGLRLVFLARRRPRPSTWRNRSWTCASSAHDRTAHLEYLVEPLANAFAVCRPPASTWPSISAPCTRGLPYPNRTPRSRDRLGDGVGDCGLCSAAAFSSFCPVHVPVKPCSV